MKRLAYLFFLITLPLLSFETTNLQLLYSNNFNGDAFIYDTKSTEKTTITFEHYRTFDYGDFFMFMDIMTGKKFDNTSSGIYAEIAPRLSLSKLSNSDLSFGVIKDVYISTQVNAGKSYDAYLYGLAVDLEIPGFNLFSINAYNKEENIYREDTYQITPVYTTKSLYNIHLNGFIDLTKRDISTHNQFLYNVDTKNQTFVGIEWIYYRYKYQGSSSKTSVIQAMVKYKF